MTAATIYAVSFTGWNPMLATEVIFSSNWSWTRSHNHIRSYGSGSYPYPNWYPYQHRTPLRGQSCSQLASPAGRPVSSTSWLPVAPRLLSYVGYPSHLSPVEETITECSHDAASLQKSRCHGQSLDAEWRCLAGSSWVRMTPRPSSFPLPSFKL
jgi:hypothetical protein